VHEPAHRLNATSFATSVRDQLATGPEA
jgi:hypothetical protein